MKTRMITLLMFLIVAFCFMSQSFAQADNDKTTMQDVKQETQELISALKGYSIDQRDEAIQKTEQALKNLDKRIDAFEARIDKNWDQMSKAVRDKTRANLKALRKQRTDLAERYGSWKHSSADAWEHMKQGFSDAYQAVEDAWEKAESEFETSKK